MPELIMTWTTPVDPGGGNPQREYYSPPIGAGWTHLYATFNVVSSWSGSFRIYGTEIATLWFNRLPQPASPFTESHPNQGYVTSAIDVMLISCNNGAAGMQASVELYGDRTGPCAAGSQRKAGTADYFSFEAADLILYLPNPVASAVFGFLGLPLVPQSTTQFCSQPPPTDLPTAEDYVKLAFPLIAAATGTYERFANQAKSDKWNALCECASGGSYTPPAAASPPAGWVPPSAGPACDDLQAVCNTIAIVYQTLLQLQAIVGAAGPTQVRSYSESTVHTALSGTGVLSLGSSAIAVKVELETDDASRGFLEGSPRYLPDRGYVVPMTAEGAQHTYTRIVYNPQLFPLPPLAPQLGYYFKQGIVGRITELTRGP